MGHIRLGRIPKTKPWRSLFEALETGDVSAAALSKATALGLQTEVAGLQRDQAINYCFWVLVRLATAARADFGAELRQLGIQPEAVSSGLGFVQQVSRSVERELKARGESSVFGRMAELTLREVLSANIVEQSRSLFGTSLDDVKSACRAISTTKNFGQVAKDFYAAFISRSIQYVTDKEISNYIGSNKPLASPQDVLKFQESVERYCRETANIVQEFAGGWFSKNNWETNNNIPEHEASDFTSYALQKIQMELRESGK
jgi:hypothetical protein